jgi:hypothetical protein
MWDVGWRLHKMAIRQSKSSRQSGVSIAVPVLVLLVDDGLRRPLSWRLTISARVSSAGSRSDRSKRLVLDPGPQDRQAGQPVTKTSGAAPSTSPCDSAGTSPLRKICFPGLDRS